jgi:endonuclease/exonuclease/phosphatase family metal-dependent hydrolase
MLFPFVHPSSLSEATQTLRNAVESANLSSFNLTLDHVDKFSQKSYNTVFLVLSRSESTQVKALWKTISDAAGYKGRAFAPHMTLGQAKSKTELGFLEEKGGRLLANRDRKLSWAVGSLVILRKDDADGGKMKIVDRILLSGAQAQTLAPVTAVSEHPRTYRLLSDATSSGHTSSDVPEGKLRITTFNVLSDELHPPSTRFALLKRDILSRPSDILCLQEVPDSLLPLLWHDPDISAIYTFSTHSADAVMPNLQNIVVLTAAHLPFTWRALPLSDNKHKTAAVLSFSLKGNDDLVIAVVHLTAGHEAPQLATRDVEAVALLSHLQTEHPNADWIVVGDMNLNSSSIPSYWADTLLDGWDLVHSNTSTSSGQDAGYTYDPVHNRLASETVKRTKQPFRYDRICVKAGGRVQVQDVVVLKAQNGSAPASDHWALCAELNLGSADAGSPADIAHVNISTTQETVSSPEVKAADPIGNTTPTAAFKWTQEDEGLEKWARNNGAYPTPEEDAARTRAINTIRTVLGGLGTSDEEQVPLPAGVKLVFEPVGSRMLGADTASSDLDVLCVGNLGQTTFFNLMRTRIRSHTRLCTAARRPATLILRRFVRDAAVPMMRLQVDGVEVDLQYAPAAKVAERWTEVPSLPADDPLFSLPASTLRVLNAHRDMVRILSLLPTDRLPSFRLALRTLKVWASNRGIAGAKFGFLGGMHLTLLLAPIAMSVAHDHSGPVRLIERFFASYEHFNFSDSIVSVSGSATAGSTYRRTPREALAILSVERPIINVSAAASVPSVAVLRREIGRGYSLTHAMHSPSVVCGTPEEGVKEFQGKYPAYAKVDISFWGKDPMRMRALLGYIESKLIKVCHVAACMFKMFVT